MTLHKQMTRRVDRDGYARLRFETLANVVPRAKIRPLMQELERRGVIECDESYCVGHYSKGYRPTESYMRANPVHVRPTSPLLIERLKPHQNKIASIQARRRKPIHGRLDEIQRAYLSIDADEARRIIDTELRSSARLSQLALVSNIEHGRMSSSVSSTRRYFNALTGVSKKVRPALRLDGEHLGAVDLTCCQPALLGMLIHFLTAKGWKGAKTYKLPLPPTARRRLTAALPSTCSGTLGLSSTWSRAGSFFDELVRLVGLPPGCASKASVKRRFFVDVLALKGCYESDVSRAFRSAFPDVATLIEVANADDYRTLIRLLQRLESRLVVETVAPLLVDRIPIVTLHDAIYCRDRDDDLALVEQAFDDVFNRIGFRIAMKREHYTPMGVTMHDAPGPLLAA